MATALYACDARKRHILSGLLAGTRNDGITDVSRAINRTFFSATYGDTRVVAPHIGGVFLTSAAVATRGNLTEKLLFCDDGQPVECGLPQEASRVAEDGRWIRGVLIVSSTLLPPPELAFLNRQCNGRMLFRRMLQLRVVSVSLPEFNPKQESGVREDGAAVQPKPQWCRLLECERHFLEGLEACLLWLLRLRRREKEARVGVSSCNETSTHRWACRGSALASTLHLPSVFDEYPPTLSVPVYYLSVRINDNATSRLADIINVTTGFMDIIVDAEASAVKETTALLQDLVQLSGMMEECAESDDVSNNNASALDERLYALHRRVTLLVDSTCHHSLPREDDSRRGGRNKNKKSRALVPMAADPFLENGCMVQLSELVLDDSPIDLAAAPCINDGDEEEEEEEEEEDDSDDVRDNSLATSSCNRSGSMSAPLPASESREMPLPAPPVDGTRSGTTPHPLPGILVHCMKGASRSPSVIMAYYMNKCRTQFHVLSHVPRTFTGSGAGETIAHDEANTGEAYVFSFLRLLQCLQGVRPVVNPQVCFLAELRFMWIRLSAEEDRRNANLFL